MATKKNISKSSTNLYMVEVVDDDRHYIVDGQWIFTSLKAAQAKFKKEFDAELSEGGCGLVRLKGPFKSGQRMDGDVKILRSELAGYDDPYFTEEEEEEEEAA